MSSLKSLIPYLDDILQSFYLEMLSHEQLSVFFKDQDAIARLVKKQKQNFIDSLDDDAAQLESRFRRLGALHYDLKVPSVDFLKSTSIWQSSFTRCALKTLKDADLILQIEEYFRKVDSFMSRGYLDRQLEDDVSDIDILIERYSNEFDSFNDTLGHLIWLKQILMAIQGNDASLAPELHAEDCTAHNVLIHPPETMLSIFSEEHFNDLHERLHNDARSLFYFISNSDYPEVLSLYANLMSVYKLTLVTLGNLSLQENLQQTRSNLANRLEKEKIYQATLHGSHHIINNLLNQLSLIRLEINKHPDFDHARVEMFDAMRSEAAKLLEKLSSVTEIDEQSIKKSVHPDDHKN